MSVVGESIVSVFRYNQRLTYSPKYARLNSTELLTIMTYDNIVSAFFETVYNSGSYRLSKEKNESIYQSVNDSIKLLFIDEYENWHITPKGCRSDALERLTTAIVQLEELLKKEVAGKAIWIDIELPTGVDFIKKVVPNSWSVESGTSNDCIRDHNRQMLIFRKWIVEDKKSVLPPAATHNIGAVAAIIEKANDTLFILLVEKLKPHDGSWCLPGGSFDPEKDPKDSTIYTALREVEEEVGWSGRKLTDAQGFLVGQMMFPNNQLAPAICQIWYVQTSGLMKLPLRPQKSEIAQAHWIPVMDIVQSKNDRVAGLALGTGVKNALAAILRGMTLYVVEEGRDNTVIAADWSA